MSQVLPIGGQVCGGVPLVHFDRSELCRLLALYSQRVADGEWRDYAIDQQSGRAVFAVFRRTLERPLFTITKRGSGRNRWEVASGPRKLRQTDSLDDALAVFDRALRLVH
jgi:hypothetical protein